MAYPTINKMEARLYLQSLDAHETTGSEPLPVPACHMKEEGAEVDWDFCASEVGAALLTMASAVGDTPVRVAGGQFEAKAAPVVHQLLPHPHPALADPEFWIWLTLTYCQPVLAWRYEEKRNLQNFGIGGSGENLIFRLWLRADIALRPDDEDQYELARHGDIDFWRSHIFRQGYGNARTFARALIEFQFPAEDGRKSRLKIGQIRARVKQLKRARSNLLFEVMSEARAVQFIQSEWDRLKPELVS